MTIELGFLSDCELWRLESRFFPSKIGGKPAWLDLKNIPGKSDLECEYCNEPCIFLCQIYAPYDENIYAFHRIVYVFICKNTECCKPNQNGNLKIFRSQLSRNNIFYSYEPPVEEKDWKTDVDVSLWSKTCRICGILAPCYCSKCKNVNYCCRSHQVYDWKNGHKETCGSKVNNKNKETCNDFLFPEYEIIIEHRDSEDTEEDDSESGQKEFEKYSTMIREGKAGTFQYEDMVDDLSQLTSYKKDETFAEFRTKIEDYPNQILRYDRGGRILYISLHNQVLDIPRCPGCNGDRQFEFQIMPQLLYYLGLRDLECLDWGILAVFTCKQSCMSDGKYAKEYVWKQDIVEEKITSEIN